MKTQREIILERINITGEVSRDFALRNFISRLGAIIDKLKSEGYEFDAYYQDYIDNGGRPAKDYVYKLLKRPELKLF
jgi:hypothetical protein